MKNKTCFKRIYPAATKSFKTILRIKFTVNVIKVIVRGVIKKASLVALYVKYEVASTNDSINISNVEVDYNLTRIC